MAPPKQSTVIQATFEGPLPIKGSPMSLNIEDKRWPGLVMKLHRAGVQVEFEGRIWVFPYAQVKVMELVVGEE